MEINKPQTIADVDAALSSYLGSLERNDVPMLNGAFLNHDSVVRFGPAENSFGHRAIREFQKSRTSADLRRYDQRHIMTFGDQFATVNLVFRSEARPTQLGRLSQTWFNTDKGWRLVAAHISFIQSPSAQQETARESS